MLNSIILAIAFMATAGSQTIDILSLASGPWFVVDDGVMGGRSVGQVATHGGNVIFSGVLSLENNGGFSSMRLPLSEALGSSSGIRIVVRGDGRRYQLRLRQGRRFDGVAWQTEVEVGPQWTTHVIAFSEFRPTFRGREVPGAGPVNPNEIRQVGVLLADKSPGPFEIEIRALEGVKDS